MNLKIGVIKGDGIGPEIVTEAMKVLDKVAEVYGHTCEYTQLLMGALPSMYTGSRLRTRPSGRRKPATRC